MVDFVAQRFDLLLATTIVRTGSTSLTPTRFSSTRQIAMPGDLHQLRGRVGRYKHRAYCYLLVDRHKHITPNAANACTRSRSTATLAPVCPLMRDLEIRGAGNLLESSRVGTCCRRVRTVLPAAAKRGLPSQTPAPTTVHRRRH